MREGAKVANGAGEGVGAGVSSSSSTGAGAGSSARVNSGTSTGVSACTGSGANSSTSTGTRGAHTREATNRKIARATMHIALEEGVKAVTIEEVSRQSGVAKTTIYRRFRNSDELLGNLSLFEALPTPEIESLQPTKANLALLIQGAVAYFDESVGVRSVGMILCSDSEFFRQVFDHLVVPLRDRVAEFFNSGKREGVFKPGADVNFVLEQVIGGMVANAAVHGAVEEKWNTQIVDFLWRSIAAE